MIDPATLEYGPQKPPKLAALAAAEAVTDLGARVAKLFSGNDRVGAFLREILAPTLVYAARIAPDVAHSPDDVDRVMQWGFGWERGPFELMDALGIREVLDAARQTAPALLEAGVPPLLQDALDAGRNRLRAGPGAAGRTGSAGAAVGEGPLDGGEVERRGQPGGPGRRRAGSGVPLEDERDRRRRGRDAAAGRAGGGAELRRAGRRQRRACTSRPAPT